MERESMGQITSDANSVFSMPVIDAMMQMQDLDFDPIIFHTAVDPTGGGASYMAVVSVVLSEDKCFIVGLDASPATGPEEISALLSSTFVVYVVILDYVMLTVYLSPRQTLGRKPSI